MKIFADLFFAMPLTAPGSSDRFSLSEFLCSAFRFDARLEREFSYPSN